MLSQADSMGHTPTFSGHWKIVCNFTCLMEGHMLAIPVKSWHDYEIDCFNFVERFRQRGKSTPQQQQPQTWQSSKKQPPQAWQQPISLLAVLATYTFFTSLTAQEPSLASVDRYHLLRSRGSNCSYAHSSPSAMHIRTVCPTYSQVTNCFNSRVWRACLLRWEPQTWTRHQTCMCLTVTSVEKIIKDNQ